MDANRYFPASYEESRARFIRDTNLLQSRWPDSRLESHPLKNHPHLGIDWLWAAPANPETLVLISTAEHGIEGYVGAAILKLFMEELAPRLNPENTGLLLIHTINPWGMQNRCRVNPHNVDLNRNFIFNGHYDPAINLAYDLLNSLLNPARPVGPLALENIRFLGQVIKGLITPGQAKVEAAALLGQHRHAPGIYFGGKERQEETDVIIGLYRRALAHYQDIVQVDIHTGFGPRYQMTVLLPSNDPSLPSSKEASQKFNYPLVQKLDASEFYAISGDICEYFVRLRDAEFPGQKLLAGGFEFGTFGESLPALIRSLRVTILENQLRHHGAKNEAVARAIRAEYGELFFPAELRWREKALADGRQALEGILRAYQLIR
ncbi:MAG: DUF2817 domain-containing protein [Chloroflexi bacterium]|nr:MAG: DUF2817 domain-containing protein [Chloroflexota bacterium]